MFFDRKAKLQNGTSSSGEMQNLQRTLEAVTEVNQAIVGVLDLDKILDLITGKLVSVIGVSFADVFVWDEQSKSLKIKSITLPKIASTLAEKVMGKPLSFVGFSANNPDHVNNIYIKSVLNNELIETKNLHEVAHPFLDKNTSSILKRLIGMKLAVSIPLSTRGIKLGALGIIWKKEVLTEEDKKIIMTFANQISTAIYNSLLFTQVNNQVTQLEAQNHDLQSLFNLSSRVSSSLDPLTVAQTAVDSLPQDETMLGAIITEHNPETNKLEIVALTVNNVSSKAEQLLGNAKKYSVDLNDPEYAPTLTYKAFMSHQPQISNDFENFLHPPVPKALVKPLMGLLNIKSVAVYPLQIRDKTIGTITYLIRNRKVEEIDSNQKRLLQTYTTQISIALDNARLFKTSVRIQKSLEQALEDLQEIRRRERDMIDIMGHELRTPLSIVRNSLSMMDMQLKSTGSIPIDKQHKYVTIGLDGIRREADLVETLLSATKVEGKGFQLTFEQVDLAHVVETSLIEFQRQAEAKDLTLSFEKPTQPVLVYADKTRIQEISDNFIGNAVKYTQTGGIKIWIDTKDNLGWIHVQDTGFGISQEDLKNLGKKFFRAKQYTKHGDNEIGIVRPGGTGLGLFVSFALAKVMDGTYTVQSELEKGSTFSFGIPLYTGQPLQQFERKIEDYMRKDDEVTITP